MCKDTRDNIENSKICGIWSPRRRRENGTKQYLNILNIYDK